MLVFEYIVDRRKVVNKNFHYLNDARRLNMIRYIKRHQLFFQILLILLASLLLIYPQLYLKGFIIGSDGMFHFNRFYDASEQIKNGNFQYFISMYGFQQSGRIVNVMYGPVFAYLQGFLVLIANSWFHYQVISNFLIYLLAGFSMFIFLKRASVKGWLSVGISIFFMTTYPVQYWIDQQGLSAWPSALFPLCLIPLIHLVEKKELPILATAISMGVMFQIHVLSTLFLAIIYFVFFVVVFFKSRNKKGLIKNLFLAIFLFLLLTMNVWANMLDIYRFDQLVPPFLNIHMENNTITAGSSYWIKYPIFLPVLFALFFGILLNRRYSLHPFVKISGFIIAVFTILATNFVPWSVLSKSQNPILGLLQFPFRFIIFAIVLLLIALAMAISSMRSSRIAKPKYLILLLLLALTQTVYQNTTKMIDWHRSDTAVNRRVHSYVFTEDERKMKNQLFSQNKNDILDSFQKSAPDYLPLYRVDNSSKYNAYGKDVIMKNQDFQKKVIGNQLHVYWKGDAEQSVRVPIIKYERTQLTLNNEQLNREDMKVSTIGVVSVNQKAGENELIVSYKAPWFFVFTLLVPAFFWLLAIFKYVKDFVSGFR
jgi:hypothetical protein